MKTLKTLTTAVLAAALSAALLSGCRHEQVEQQPRQEATQAQAARTDAAEPECYFTQEEMPDMLKFMPAPPDSTSIAFAHDVARYYWGKQMRLDPVRGTMASRDADWTTEYVAEQLGGTFGMPITPEATPATFRLLANSLATADLIGRKAKAHYMRRRPFDRFNEPSLVPADDDELRHNGSYPSGHTIRGWSAALILSELNPAQADTILARGRLYGESRVIVGAHWQSDVDAGMVAASAAVVKMHTSKDFVGQLEKARQELADIKAKNN